MRYTLHSHDGVKLGEAPTAQKAADIATHRTITHDTWGGRYPFIVWSSIPQGMLGEPYQTHKQAQRACAKLPKEVK